MGRSTSIRRTRRARRRPHATEAKGVLLVAAMVGTVLVGLVGAAPPAQAYSDVGASISGLGCSSNNTVSNWGSATAPTNAVGFSFTIIGGGGSAGDNHGGQGGRGGRGARVTGYHAITAGERVWAIDGCGGIDGGGSAAGYATGRNRSNLSGGGGGASALCIGTSSGSCGGGTMIAIAGGGGGGARGSGDGACSDKVGGAGGDAGSGGGSTGSGGGTGYKGANGGQGDGSSPGGGGGAGGPGGQGGARSTQGHNNNNENGFANAVPPAPGGTKGNGGIGAAGNDDEHAGGGGGGYGGGGGGGGGRDGNCVFGNWDSGGGGGSGGSWHRSTVSSQSVGTVSPITSCSANATGGSNAGAGANQGSQTWGCGGSISVTWRIGNPPTGGNQTTGTATKGVALSISLANADADGNNRTCSIVSSPTKGNVTLSGGNPGANCTASYTANANTSGNDSFTYRLTDSDGLVSPTYTVTIPIGNRAPTGANQSVGNVNKVTPATTINLANTDPDGDSPLTCTVVAAPSKGTVSGGTSCSRSYAGSPNQLGADSFTYRVNDAYGGQSPTYTVTVNIVNRVPSGANQSLTVDAGLATAVAMANSDVDGDTLTCPTSTPTKGVLSGGTSCARTYTSNAGSPNAGVGGADSFTYSATDPHGAASPAGTVSITIVNPDLSLTKSHTGRFQPGTGTGTYTIGIANSNVSTANGTTTITDTLPAGMAYRSHDAGSSGFTCSGTPGVSTTVTCTRASQIPKNFSGSLTITVDVAETAGSPGTNTAVISSLYELASTAGDNTAVDATDVNRRPTAANVNVGTTEGNAVLVGLVGNDLDGDPLSYDIVAPPFNGTLSGSGASRQYIPDGGFIGVDQFTYRVTDNEGLQSTVATVKIYVGVSAVGGVLTNEVTSAPLANMDVYLIDNADPAAVDPQVWGPVQTDALGAYDLASLFPSQGAVPFGNYVVRFVDPARNFISEFHVDAPNRAAATNVAVSDAAPDIRLDAALTPGARVQGIVRSTEGGSPTIDGLQVRLFEIGQPGSKAATTSGGAYEFDLLPAGDYQLWFRDVNSGTWVSEWYDEQSTQANAATVSLTVGQQLVINEELDPVVEPEPPTTGTITGTVRSDQLGNAPISGVQVRLYSEADGYVKSPARTTDANGTYTFTDVVTGNYKLWFRSMSGTQWVSEYHDDQSTLAGADPIAVAEGTNIVDAFLSPPAAGPPPSTAVISGTVTELDGVTPIAGLQVRLYVDGVATGSSATYTDEDGNYAFTNRAPGLYQVWFRDVSNSTWLSEWHLDQPNQASADAVTATSGSTTTVDAQITYR